MGQVNALNLISPCVINAIRFVLKMISQYEVSLPGLKQPFANRVVALFICMTQIFSHRLVWVCV